MSASCDPAKSRPDAAQRGLRACLLLIAVAVPIVLLAGSDSRPAKGASTAQQRWERWHHMTPAARSEFIAQYEALLRRSDAPQILAGAAEFAGLAPAHQRRLRDLNALLARAAAEQPPVQRRWLESLPGDARAVELMRILRSDYKPELQQFLAVNGH